LRGRALAPCGDGVNGLKRVTLNGLVARIGSIADNRRAAVGPILRRNGWAYFAIGVRRGGELHIEYVSVGRGSAEKQRDMAINALRHRHHQIIETENVRAADALI
jgi:hypothetical protein